VDPWAGCGPMCCDAPTATYALLRFDSPSAVPRTGSFLAAATWAVKHEFVAVSSAMTISGLASISSDGTYFYRCVLAVASGSGSPSASRSRSVSASRRPAGVAFGADAFESATSVALVTGSASFSGSTSTATRQTGEPVMLVDSGESASVWATWTAPGSGTLRVTITAASFDTLLGVYRSAATPALVTLVRLQVNDDCSSAVTTSCVVTSVTAGQRYYFQVDGYSGETGTFTLQFAFTAA
jgi:hypothetical protein